MKNVFNDINIIKTLIQINIIILVRTERKSFTIIHLL